jgi:hypothetical protein
MAKVFGCGSLLAAVVVVTACSGSGGSAPSSRAPSHVAATSAASSASQAVPSTPTLTSFTSAMYGYTVTLPAQWVSVPATKRWDGNAGHAMAGLSHDAADVDQFVYNANLSSWAVAAAWKQDLAAYTVALIAANARYHGDSCPARPQARTAITIGGSPGILLAYDCGILVNIAGVVHHGVGYRFGFRDLNVHAATDPADHAAFTEILGSVQFPG